MWPSIKGVTGICQGLKPQIRIQQTQHNHTPVTHKNPTTIQPVVLQAPFEYFLLSKPLSSCFIFHDVIVFHKPQLSLSLRYFPLFHYIL